MQPLVSICIPTYNRASLVKLAIRSAQRQTYPNLEIIVADNCSTDETAKIVQDVSKQDPRVLYLRNEKNVGPTRNWQMAVNRARGEFCKILFSDDEMSPDFVSECVGLFKKGKDVAFVFTDAMLGNSFEDGTYTKNYHLHEGLSSSEDFILKYLLWQDGAVSPSCALFRTTDLASKIVMENPLFETDRYARNGAGPDSLTFLNAASVHDEIAYVPKPLTLFRTSADSITMCAIKSEDTLTTLCVGYAKARYQFLREATGQTELFWYFRFLATMTGACRKSRSRKQIADEFKLKNERKLMIFDFVLGLFQRHFRNLLVKPKLRKVLAQRKKRA